MQECCERFREVRRLSWTLLRRSGPCRRAHLLCLPAVAYPSQHAAPAAPQVIEGAAPTMRHAHAGLNSHALRDVEMC